MWPADWTARRHADGSAQLLDDNGRPVAQTGQYIASGGGGISEPGDLVCEASTDGDVFTIMAEVTVTDLAVGELPLSTSDWRPGDDAQRAQLSGVLQVDEKGCLYVAGPDGHGIDVVWPAGWAAHRLRDGSVELREDHGQVQALTGQHITAGGGQAGPQDLVCRALGAEGVFAVQSFVTVVK